MEMRKEVISSVGAQDMDTSEYQVCDLENIEHYCGNEQLDVCALSGPGIGCPFSPTALDNLEIEGQAENAKLPAKEEDKENSPPTTPDSERQTRPPALLRSRPFGTTIENVTDYVNGNIVNSMSITVYVSFL